MRDPAEIIAELALDGRSRIRVTREGALVDVRLFEKITAAADAWTGTRHGIRIPTDHLAGLAGVLNTLAAPAEPEPPPAA